MKLSATPETDRLARVIDGLGECIENARSKSTIVQSKDGPVDKPTPDYATEFKCWVAVATLWGLGTTKGARKSAEGEAGEAEDGKLAALSAAMLGAGDDEAA
jgi:hypothetical protein